MICQVCGGHFEESDLYTANDRVPYGDTMIDCNTAFYCPDCGSQQICEEGYCAECASAFPEGELEDGLCRLCVEEARQALDWMWGMLTPPQRQYAVNHTEWMEA